MGFTSSAEDFITETINVGLRLGGEQVSHEQYKARLEVCHRCELAGTVRIDLPFRKLELEGCTECGCPFATKPKWEKYFSFEKLRIIKAQCPHPEGNKWASADSAFSQTKIQTDVE